MSISVRFCSELNKVYTIKAPLLHFKNDFLNGVIIEQK